MSNNEDLEVNIIELKSNTCNYRRGDMCIFDEEISCDGDVEFPYNCPLE